ncbi:MAG TPA: O-antigen ligase family protein [Pirellulales bacterium]|jgi:tetratricopeptide (TPR) repeat protein|nr:O-antigen ligase family protein [Pirellulales bacterium]
MKSKRAKPAIKRAPPPPKRDWLELVRCWLLIGFVGACVARPLVPSEGAAWLGDDLPFDLLLLLVATGTLLWSALRGGLPRRLHWIDAFVAALFVTCVIASFQGASTGSPRPSLNMLWQWVGAGLVYFLTRQLIAGAQETRALAAAMVGLALALSAFGYYQVFVSLPADRAAYAANPEQVMLESLGQVYPEGSPERLRFEDRLKSTEPLATFALTNSLAGVLVAWLVVAIGIAWQTLAKRDSAADLLRTSVIAVNLAAIAGCLILTKSRSAYAGFAVGAGLLFLAIVRSRVAAIDRARTLRIAVGGAVALAALVVIATMLGGIDIQVLSEAGKSLGFRGQYWRATLSMISANPLLGVGPGNFQDYYTRFKLPQASEEVRDPHNFVLEVWATAGTVAALALIGAIVMLVRRELRGAAQSETEILEKPDEVETRVTTGTLAVLAAAAAGPAIAFVAAPPFGYVLAEGQVLAAVGLGAMAIAIFWPWIRSGMTPRYLFAIAWAALAVHLLTSGGIAFPGVAGSFWMLFALAVNERPRAVEMPTRASARQRLLLLGAGVGTAALGWACWYAGYEPVLAEHLAMTEATKVPHPQARAIALIDASKADPLSAEPWIASAELQLELMRRSSAPASAYRNFVAAAEKVSDLRPNSSATWRQLGKWFLAAYEINGLEAALDRAADCLRSAISLYPTSAVTHADLALVLDRQGKADVARRQAERALELDDAMPHVDKKLSSEIRAQLTSLVGRAS